MVKVKICGITTLDDARAAVSAGADAIGLVFAPSPRRISPERAREIVNSLPPFVLTVGVCVNESPERVREIISSCGVHYIQFHGDEPPEVCNAFGKSAIKAVRMRDADSLRGMERYRVAALLLDSYVKGIHGGTAETFPWAHAAGAHSLGMPIILSGGLNAQNVVEAVKAVRPFAVDVSSGVESEPGKKDHRLMAEFIRLAKSVENDNRGNKES
ncbi:MAG: phosphoribosylanthranilate isomerase [Candidatus Aureabacteria bacterium]|nr:phosphoribosylanthranilate isomerase [Candidatus Auribacterota bacterium]